MNACDVFLFAAGLGTRLRPFTNQNPKPVLPLLSYPLGYYPLPYLQPLSISKFIVNTFHLPNQIHELYQKTNLNPVFSDETGFIKGSAGGLKQAEKIFSNQTILTINADEVLFTHQFDFLKHALAQHIQQKNLATLIVKEHHGIGTEFGGIWATGETVKNIGKMAPPPGLKGWHFIGFQFLSAEILKTLPAEKEANIFYDYLINHLDSNRVKIFPVEGDWYETGNLQDYKTAHLKISEKIQSDQNYKKFFELMNSYPKSRLADLA